jgi:uncharacterized membrane protein YcaP (DUF421 family)
VDIVIRSAVVFLLLWVVTRALGKRELSEMTAFEMVLLITVGDLVQQGATQEDMSLTGAALAVSTIALLVLATSFVSFRWRGARRLVEGAPVLVVYDGQVRDEALRLERITRDEVDEAARNQGIARLADVRWGVLEPDGRFSFVVREPSTTHPHHEPHRIE